MEVRSSVPIVTLWVLRLRPMTAFFAGNDVMGRGYGYRRPRNNDLSVAMGRHRATHNRTLKGTPI